jgi:hypothetical protein
MSIREVSFKFQVQMLGNLTEGLLVFFSVLPIEIGPKIRPRPLPYIFRTICNNRRTLRRRSMS